VNTVADKHEMVLSSRAEPGAEQAEEWNCPRCGRRLLLRWPPHPEKLVLEQGDVTAIHIGGKGGVRAGGVTAARVPPAADRQWLRDQGIDWDGTPA
jgi:hypothetical protein